MGFRRRFELRLALRLAAFVAATVAFVWVVGRGGMPVAALVAAGAMLWAAAAIWSLVQRTNTELARFVTAIGQRDLTQSFAGSGRGGGFDGLASAFDEAMRALRTVRAQGTADNHFAGALVDGAPTPLLTIDGDGRVDLANKAARRLFAGVKGTQIDDYAPFGGEFVEALRAATAGRRSTRLVIDGLPQRTMLSVTAVEREGAAWRIVSVQVIQHELDQAELSAQTDLVRVLTHEIMNSMTPVTSLAASAARLMTRIDTGDDPAIADVRTAIETLARRADGTMRFVESYRLFARTPAVSVAPFDGRDWADELARLFAASPLGPAVRLDVTLPLADFAVQGDAELLTQVTLNLLKNAAEAAIAHAAEPRVCLALAPLADGRARITVSDNGAGIAERYAQDVFLPFFTTKRDGTGVGLSFARQIVLLHGGTIGVLPTDRGAAIEYVV